MSIFEFKQFSITQKESVFKIGTDSILMGCLPDLKDAKHVLEIGTGSGVISLMLAQRFPQVHITGLEPHEDSFLLSTENIKRSPFADKISIQNHRLQDLESATKWDAIVSNPPYFNEKDMPHATLSHARMQKDLSFEDIFSFTQKNLSKIGKLYLIYPFDRVVDNIKIAADYTLYPNQHVYIKGNPKTSFKRCFTMYQFEKTPVNTQKLVIEYKRGQFTSDYQELTKDFHPMF